MPSYSRFALMLVFAAFAAQPTRADYSSTVMSQGPSVYWRLNETTPTLPSVTTATNLGFLGSSENATYLGSQLFYRGATGVVAGDAAAAFNGLNQSVQAPYTPSLNPSANFSIEAWLAPALVGADVPANFICALSCGDFASPRAGWLIYQTPTGWTFRMYNQNGPNFSLNLPANTNMVAGNYYHLVVTYDGSFARFYVNGQLLSTGAPGGSPTYVPGTAGPFAIGSRSDNTFYWRGGLDEVAFYGTVLNQSTISQHYGAASTNAAGYAGLIQSFSPLVYYRLNEPGDPKVVNLGSLGSLAEGALAYPASVAQIGPRPVAFPGFESTNRAVSFASGGYMQAPPLNLNTNGLTVTCWVRPSGAQPPHAGIVFHRTRTSVGGPYSSTAGLKMGSAGGSILGYNWDGDADSINWSSGVSLTDAAWNFAALIVQPSQAIVYVPGGTNSTPATNRIAHAVLPFEGATYLALDPHTNIATTTRTLVGSMDEVAIFRRALSLGEVYSQYAAAVGNLPPKIFAHPQTPAATLYAGDPLTLSVDAGGTPGVSFQWRKNGSPIGGATQSIYTLASLTTGDSGLYSLVVTNTFGVLTSGVATVTVSNPVVPIELVQLSLSSCTVYTGGVLRLEVPATGGGVKHQWQKNGTNLVGKTNSALSVASVTSADAGAYRVVMTNTAGGKTSGVATVTVPIPTAGSYESAIIADAPMSWYRLDNAAGTSLMRDAMGRADGYFTNLAGPATSGVGGALTANGNTAVHFDLPNQSWGEVPSLPPPVTTGDFTFECWMRSTNTTDSLYPLSSFRNRYGFFFQRAATGAVGSGNGYGDLDESDYRESSDTNVVAGQWVHLVAIYSNTVGHKVYVNGVWDGGGPFVDFSRNLNTPLRIGAVGLYPGALTDFFSGEVDEVAVYSRALSDARILAHYQAGLSGANAAPFITSQPASQTAFLGGSFNLTAQVGGTLPLSLRWTKNGVTIPGATTATLNFPTVYATNIGNYHLIATNGFGAVTTAVATITVICPTVTVTPTTLASAGAGVAYTQSLGGSNGTGPYTFTVSAGALPSGLTLSSNGVLGGTPTAIGTGNFTVTATDSFGCGGIRAYSLVVTGAIPAITVQPRNTTVGGGANASFTVSVGGTSPFTYFWGVACPLDDPRWPNCGCAPIPPCYPNSPTLLLNNVTTDNAGGYYVVVSNAFGAATSQTATLTVINTTNPPVISQAGYNGNIFTIVFASTAGFFYAVEYKNTLGAPSWTRLTTVLASSSLTTVQDPFATSSSRFYRIVNIGPLTSPQTVFEPPQSPPAQPGAPTCNSMQDDSLPRLYSGEVHYSARDLVIRGIGMDFNWVSTYRSKTGTNTALGNGWDFSYNLRVLPSGQDFEVWDGTGRSDIYRLQADGTYAAEQLFTEGTLSNNVFRIKFSDRSTWEFLPLDGSLNQGRVLSITDRNGNALGFGYNAGQLTNIVDTLGRNIQVAYTVDGFIASVTDFTGRQVVYDHYQNSDTNGSFGDLKSVRSPVVTNTPNGNDFPAGKTTTFTYSRGFSDERLNHNLLTITDPAGQIWLRNVYATNTDQAAHNFDRVLFQTRGYSNEILSFYYKAQPPLAANQFAVSKAIVNDRMGNVAEYLFDATNRVVRLRQFTGRAVPGVTTTETSNRPVGKLRSWDPDFFETRYEWNADSMPVRVTYPNGNSVEKTYELALNPATPRRLRGNLRVRTTYPGPLGGDQPSITESFAYDTTFGACCGFNFVTQETDGRGNTAYHSYDERGNRTNTIYRVPSSQESYAYDAFGRLITRRLPDNGSGYRTLYVYEYYTNGPQAGYLQREIADSQTLARTTTYEYDARGNLVRRIDPRGFDTLYTYNALDQVVREVSAETASGSGIRFTNHFFYDAHDNRVRVDVQNRDHLGVIDPTLPVLTTTYDYDILNRPIRSSQQVSSGQSIVSELFYNANGKPALARFGQATSGADTNNVRLTLYDERNLPFQEIRAPGSAAQSTTQFDYDGNGNLTRTSQGLEGVPRTLLAYSDGYNRTTNSVDAMGNASTNHFDANGNLTAERVDGELLDVPGSAGNVRLKEVAYTYDAMNRRIATVTAFFDPQTQTNFGSGFVTNLTSYNDSSQVMTVVDANGNTTSTTYDTDNRVDTETDAKGNTDSFTYDENGNRITATQVDKSDLGGADRVQVTTYAYDGLNRLAQTTDHLGQMSLVAYDSRNNPVISADNRGNITRLAYDGLNRLIRRTVTMTSSGDGGGAVIGSVTNLQAWDDSSRLESQTDNNTNTTRYVYDSLDRRVRTEHADGTVESSTYDVHGNRTSSTDANTNIVTYTYDALNRVVTNSVSRGTGVIGTTFERYEYDGLSRLIRLEDNQSRVTRRYDSLSHLIRDTQQLLPGGVTNVVTTAYDGAGNLARIGYPGGRTIVRTYDALNRPLLVRDEPQGTNLPIATFSYTGPALERRDYGNGTRLQPLYDLLRRATNHTHSRIVGGLLIESRGYAWDGNNNTTNSTDLLAGPQTKSYAYDSLDRLVHSDVSGGPTVDYTLDGVGNRLAVAGAVDAGAYSLSPVSPLPQDRQMNRYTGTPFDTRAYDRNGNLTSAGGRLFAYDYRNRLVQFSDTNLQVYTYQYDALGRRLGKTTAGSTNRYVYAGVQEIEEQNGAGVTVATFVWGEGIDELLQMVRGGQTYFYHGDDLDSVRKITDASGAVVESYQYGDYGAPQFFDGAGSPLAGTQIGNLTLFTGRRYDPELGWYFFRTRYLDPRAGRFVTADTVGNWEDSFAMGNAYAYVGNNPDSRTDPMGTKSWRKRFKKAVKKVREIVAQVARVAPRPVVGVAGDLQFCADLTTGNWDLSGRLWAGYGVKAGPLWTGLSYSVNGRISYGNDDRLKWFTSKGTCQNSCEARWLKFASPIIDAITVTANYPPLECTIKGDIMSHSCRAELSVYCQADLVRYIGGPITVMLAEIGEKLGAEAQAGAVGSFTLNACAGDEGPRLDFARVCLGAYVRVGLNISDHP